MGMEVCPTGPGKPAGFGVQISLSGWPLRAEPTSPLGGEVKLAEHAQRQIEGDSPVRLVDDLADAQVARQAAEDVSVLPAQAVVRGQPVDGVAHGVARVLHQVGAEGADRVVAGSIAAWLEWRGVVGGRADRAAEGSDRNVDIVPQLGRGPVAEVEVADIRVGEVGSQQAEPWQQGGPAPRSGLQLDDLHLERVAGFGPADVDRAAQRVEAVKVEGAELRGRVALLELARCHLLGVEVDDVAWVDLHHRRQRVVPLVVELVAPDLVLANSGSNAHLRTSWVAPSWIGTAFARSTFLSNLPTEVLGTSSMKRTSSGSHHLATLSRRKSTTSSCVTLPLNSGLGTAKTTGRSSHFVWGKPMTAASMILGWAMTAFSSSTDEIHSPPDLITSLVRSTIWM